MEIRRGLPSDFELLKNQVVQSFREHTPGHPRFEYLFPDVVNADPEIMSYWRLAFVDGQLAGGIEVVPRHVKFGDSQFTCGGIGNVHCFQKFRREGCFSALIQRVIEDMDKEGWGVSVLGGDRIRYGNYGWEVAGHTRNLTLSAHVRRFDHLEPAPSANEFREYLGDDSDAKKMWDVQRMNVAGPNRKSLKEFKAAYSRPRLVTYLNERAEEGFAFITISGNSILEYGGTVKGVERILRSFLRSSSMNINLPDTSCDGDIERMFMQYAQGYSVSSAGSIRVNSMKQTLTDYLPWLGKRLANWNGERVIAMDEGEKIAVSVKDGAVQVADTDKAPQITLTRCEVARLFFGPFMPSMGTMQEDDFCRLAFPFPFTWFPLEHC